MKDINAAARLRVAAAERAEADKVQQVKRAEGEAESKYLAGVGVARQRQAIVEGLRRFVPDEKSVMDMVLATQYFDTIRDIGATSRAATVFIPHGPAAVHDVATQVRDGVLQAAAHSPAARSQVTVSTVVFQLLVHSCSGVFVRTSAHTRM